MRKPRQSSVAVRDVERLCREMGLDGDEARLVLLRAGGVKLRATAASLGLTVREVRELERTVAERVEAYRAELAGDPEPEDEVREVFRETQRVAR